MRTYNDVIGSSLQIQQIIHEKKKHQSQYQEIVERSKKYNCYTKYTHKEIVEKRPIHVIIPKRGYIFEKQELISKCLNHNPNAHTVETA